MAHHIESAMFAREGAWHGLGKIVDTEQTWEDAMEAAGLDWEVVKQPLFLPYGSNDQPLVGDLKTVYDELAEDGTGFLPVEGAFATIRKDTGAVLGTVGAQYEPFQNMDAFRFMDEAIGKGLATFNAAGSLKGGRHIWCLCRLPGNLGTKLDPSEKYLLLSQAHDGTKALHVLITSIRVVCWNTLNWAWGDGDKTNGFKARHSRNIYSKVVDAQRLVAEAEDRLEEFDKKAHEYMGIEFTDESFRALAMNLMPPPEKARKSGKIADIPTSRVNAWDAMFKLFKGGRGQDLKTAKNTAWGAVNAIAEYVDYERTTRGTANGNKARYVDKTKQSANRLTSALWGSGATMKQDAVNMIEEFIVADGDATVWTPATGSALVDQMLN